MNSPLLDKKTLEELKGALKEQKETLEKELSGFAEKNENIEGDWKTKYKDVGNDWDDNAHEVTDYATNVSIEHTLELRLKKVNEAILRIENNEYGFCVKDGEPIPIERLRANPETTNCLEHAR